MDSAPWSVAPWFSPGGWSRDDVERQRSHQECNNVRTMYIHIAEHLEARQHMMQWWAGYWDANRSGFVSSNIGFMKNTFVNFKFIKRMKVKKI